jgi:hypothetical protein
LTVLLVQLLHAVCSTPPENPDGGAFSCANTTTAGSSCTATCSTGFTGLPTTPRVTCQADGTWSSATGACTRGEVLVEA